MGMDRPLLEWLNTYTFPLEAHFSDTSYAGKIYSALADKLIRNGTTRLCAFSSLHTDSTLILMEELEKRGITGYVGKVNMDRNGGKNLEETTEESERETLRWLDGCSSFRLIHPILTPRFTPSCTDALLSFLGNLAQERGLRVQSHLTENTAEIEWVKSLHPDCSEYWETYDKYGLLKENTLMAHCVHSSEREMDAIRERGAVVVHCPDSNLNLSSGTAEVKKMLKKGLRVTLGSDIAAGAEIRMYRTAASAIRSSKIRRMGDSYRTEALTVSEAYYLASSSAHFYFGDRPGFAPGNRLHAVIVDDSSFPAFPEKLSLEERLERALYLMDESNIKAVWANGVNVVKNT